MSKIIRTADIDVNPVDDAIIFKTALKNDGLLIDATITSLGGNVVKIGANRGMVCGRDYYMDESQINVAMSPTSEIKNGRIILELNLSANTVEYSSELEPYTELTQEDLNNGGNVYQYVYATYKADNVSVKSVSKVCRLIGEPIVIELGTTWSDNKQTVHLDGVTANDYPMYDVKLDGTQDQIETDVEEFNKILRVETKTNELEFTCSEPTVNPINILFKF